jgi:hypothetical protein
MPDGPVADFAVRAFSANLRRFDEGLRKFCTSLAKEIDPSESESVKKYANQLQQLFVALEESTKELDAPLSALTAGTPTADTAGKCVALRGELEAKRAVLQKLLSEAAIAASKLDEMDPPATTAEARELFDPLASELAAIRQQIKLVTDATDKMDSGE